NVRVQVKDKDDKVVATAFTDKDGIYTVKIPRSPGKKATNGGDNTGDGAGAGVVSGPASDGASNGSRQDSANNANKNDANKDESTSSEYVVSTEADDYRTERKFSAGSEDVRVNIPIEDRPVSLLTRAVVGYQQAAAASSDFEQNYFFDMFVRNS